MGIKEWCNSRSQSIRLGQPYMPSNYNPGWQRFWKKFKMDKKKKSFSSSTVTPQAPSYDPKTYSKNFDRGMGSMEPDNLSRNFSARFADPSMILHNNKNLLD
ncbi:PREDICTED: unnamed product [Prunus dulcis]|uniref:PREDICTED: unnamed product n=1 Tax=Prunus dulcis TaxID=3755 RepID=A0A5E4EJU0_PRUDU|nr:PREDICTED: unnamed product [Prunus dulcis]